MRRGILQAGVAVLAVVAAPAVALCGPATHKEAIAKALTRVDPSFRAEQRCDARAMGEVQRHHPGMSPDELVAYAFADVKTAGTKVVAHGAAVRSRGTWYHLSYECTTTPDGLDIVSLQQDLGDAVPRSDWDRHYLVQP